MACSAVVHSGLINPSFKLDTILSALVFVVLLPPVSELLSLPGKVL